LWRQYYIKYAEIKQGEIIRNDKIVGQGTGVERRLVLGHSACGGPATPAPKIKLVVVSTRKT
jgi:hypothetical protein